MTSKDGLSLICDECERIIQTPIMLIPGGWSPRVLCKFCKPKDDKDTKRAAI